MAVGIILSVTATVHIGGMLKLKKIADEASTTEGFKYEYNPEKFGALRIISNESKTIAMVQDSGEITICGASSEDEAKQLAQDIFYVITHALEKIQEHPFQAKFDDFQIKHIRASCELQVPIELGKLMLNHGHLCSDIVNSQGFVEGLLYRMEEPKIACFIYASGKIRILGAKRTEEVFHALNKLYSILK